MSQFKKLALAIISVVGLTTFCYAAVIPVTETYYGVKALGGGSASRSMQTPTPAPAAAGEECVDPYTTCDGAVYDNGTFCSFKPGMTDVECKSMNCCASGSNVSYKVCPDDFIYDSATKISLPKDNKLEYCEGYSSTNYESKYRYRQDFEDCYYHDIIDDTYITAIIQAAGSYIGTMGTCKDDGGTITYGTVHGGTYSSCPSDSTQWSISDDVLIDNGACEGSSVFFTCAVKCGDDTYCGARTCSVGELPLCSEAAQYEAYKDAIGDLRYVGYKSTEDTTFKYACRATDGATEISYAGFNCSKSTFNATEEQCTENGFNTSDVNDCEITDPDTGATQETWYECNCNDTNSWYTLSEYCTKNGISADKCSDKYMVKSSATGCTLFNGFDGTKKRYKAEAFFDQDQLCARNETLEKSRWRSFLDEDNWVSNYLNSMSNVNKLDGCYELKDGEPKDAVAIYNCQNYIDYATQKSVCEAKNPEITGIEPLKCEFDLDSQMNGVPAENGNVSSEAYLGCNCGSGFYTKKDLCGEDEDCLKFAVIGDGAKACFTLVKPKLSSGITYDNVSDSEGEIKYDKWECHSDYVTQEEWCAANPNKIMLGLTCNDYKPSGVACNLDGVPKYHKSNFKLKCPSGWTTVADADKDKLEKDGGCKLDENSEPKYDVCYNNVEDETSIRYICKCPDEYGTECDEAYKLRGGTKCTFDKDITGNNINKYSGCYIACGHEFATSYSETVYGCEGIDIYASPVRVNEETSKPEQCVHSSSRELNYICGCPNNFQEVKPWCDENYENEGLELPSQCYYDYMGSGTRCRRDISVNDGKVSILTKYAYYIRNCPTNRPLYYSEEDCQAIKGEYEAKCRDENGIERVVCQCPIEWYDSEGNNKNSGVCEPIDGYDTEASGSYCDFDGEENLKYQDCIVKCNDALNDSSVVEPNAYTYLDSTSKTPTQTMCTQQMGNGAVLGVAGYAYCSLNHTIMYPCYCPSDFKECLAENNEIAADGAQVCKVNGKTYYSDCNPVACKEPSSTRVIVDGDKTDEEIQTMYGNGVEIKRCSQDNQEKKEVTCDASAYPDPCDYPYEAPGGSNYCKYGDGSTLMESGREHYKSGACKIRKTLGACGTEIAGEEGNTNLRIFVAATESECKSKYGNAISTQLCEYGKEQGYKRAYNCYYDSTHFIWTTRNCGVRHNLSGEYLIINGVKHWNQCRCARAYQHHKFNCGGLLSGSPCQQQIDAALLTEDPSLNEAEQGNFIDVNDTLPFYPYCECSADYTEVCDEDGTGRYKGVGTACNGKYQSCECVPDPLPDNWTDNYYGCAGGKKPTGVWKDNGCGKKYWQCTVNECTWEYTEMCEAPLIPLGESCQDNQGNIGGYKACTCPSDYKTCPVGQVGEGEPCNLKGVSYYKTCKSQDACNSLANETCTGPLQIGINPCTRDTVTYYESCVCANGYDKACGEGEVGVGNYCELDGIKYYKECAKPEDNQCTAGHVTACDTNQESYSPCEGRDENGKPVVKYLCKCPSNWKACSGGSGEQCTQKNSDGQETTYWSECNSGAATCSDYQELTYKVCTSAQTGDGGSCTSTITSTGTDGSETQTTVVKYAECKDSGNCLTNGFRYSCSGYDTKYLGESCVDDNGNKLYKECPCPTSYVPCSNSNATKGNKCTPLNKDGNFGTTVYSSCECDRSKYKYTCKTDEENDPLNKGIKTPDSNSFCEVTEIQKQYDKDGNVIRDEETGEILTEEVKVRYFSYCECKEEYKYTCSDVDHGEVLPDGWDDEDGKGYCKINGTRFYTACDCDKDKYSVEAETCQNAIGQQVDLTSGSCTVRGSITESIINADGSVTTTKKKNTTYYKGCECKPTFSLECKNSGSNTYLQSGIESCSLSGTALYPQCRCATQKTCQSTSTLNVGIIGDDSTKCENRVADGKGGYDPDTVYTKCICDPSGGWDTPENLCNGEQYVMENEQYCYTGETGDVKMYKKCICDSTIYEEAVYGSKDANSYCTAIGMSVNPNVSNQFCTAPTDGSSGEEYHANKGLCYTSNLSSDWIDFGISSLYSTVEDFIKGYSDIEEEVEKKCNHRYNASFIVDSVGKVYYKCVNNTVKSGNWWTSTECSTENTDWTTTGGSSQTINNGWKGTVTVYNRCDCSSNYSSDTDSCSAYSCKKRINDSISSCKATQSTVACTNIDANAIVKKDSKNECIKRDGTKKYYKNNCTCNINVFDKSYGACNEYSYKHEDYKCTDVTGKRYRIAKDKGDTTNQGSGACDSPCDEKSSW